MEKTATAEMVLADLEQAVQRFFGLNVLAATPIQRGWLNLKWHIKTDAGQFLLKQYNKDRFKLYDPLELEFAFAQQTRLRQNGLPCPRLLMYDGRALIQSEQGEMFLVMEYCDGRLIPPGKVNAQQVYELGKATGCMHRLLNDGTLGRKASAKFIPPSREQRLAHWEQVREQAAANGGDRILAEIERQRKATEQFDFTQLEALEPGWAHRDLWVDNLLFTDDRVAAILDFDRLNYDYPQLDVARAVMSCAYDGELDVTLAASFLEGYREERAVAKGFLAQSLQLLWYMESTWWINANMDKHSVPPARFAKEMSWLAANQHLLPGLAGSV